ncbi:MAG: hypothetical protein NZ703_03205 [Gemmataceae bacterium]|nr:hypothetical protein [Gemmataceae bacterium]
MASPGIHAAGRPVEACHDECPDTIEATEKQDGLCSRHRRIGIATNPTFASR